MVYNMFELKGGDLHAKYQENHMAMAQAAPFVYWFWPNKQLPEVGYFGTEIGLHFDTPQYRLWRSIANECRMTKYQAFRPW